MSNDKQKIKLEEIILCTTNKDNKPVFKLLSAFLRPNPNGVTPTGKFPAHYKWNPIEEWLTEQMGRDDIGARSIELRGAQWILSPGVTVSIALDNAEDDFHIRLQAIRSEKLRLPFTPDSGMAVIEFVNPTSKKRSTELITQQEFEKKMANPPKPKKRKLSHDEGDGRPGNDRQGDEDNEQGGNDRGEGDEDNEQGGNDREEGDEGTGNGGNDRGEGDKGKEGGAGDKTPGASVGEPIELEEEDDHKAVFKALGDLPKLDSDDYWREVCEFFCRDPNTTTEIKIPKLRIALLPHQATMVYYVLTRCRYDIVSAGMADDMGLGKTFTTIATIIVFNHLHEAYSHVQKMLTTDDGSTARANKRQHNMPDSPEDQNDGPTIAVGISGSLLSSPPQTWEALLAHTFYWSAAIDNKLSFGKMKSTNFKDQFKILCANWKFLKENLRLDTTDPIRQRRLDQALEAVKDVCISGIFGQMIVGRGAEEDFRGQNIVALEPLKYYRYETTLYAGKSRDAIRKLCRGVRAFVNQKYNTEKEKWDKSPQGLEPRLQDTGYTTMRNQAEGAAYIIKSCGESYFRLHQCSTYPFLARLYSRLDVEKAFKSSHIASAYAKPYTEELSLGNRTKENLVTVLKKSPFWKYRYHLMRNSSKFDVLSRVVDKLIDLKTEPQDEQPDNGPADGSNVRNLIVFTDSPLSAYLTAMLLVEKYGDEVEPLLFHSSLPETATVGLPNHSRIAVKEHFDADCRPGDKNKILIGTYLLLATGHNLQARTSEAVLMDIARESDRKQAVTRLWRLGQTMSVVIHEAWCRANLFEAHRMVIGSLKSRLRPQAFDHYDYVNWKYYTNEDDLRALSPASDGTRAITPVPDHPDALNSDADEPQDDPEPDAPPIPESIDLTQVESDEESDEDVEEGEPNGA
ncbi:hypothetical protein LQW54_010215 [Pestalotiopsis sp. IQ-011]